MSLQKQTISWPLTGGLDTKRSPLAIQPGSFLQVDNAIQERAGEWRRRNGFTQVAGDTSTLFADAFHVGNLGLTGLIGHDSAAGPGVYRPSISAAKWSALASSDYPSDITRIPIAEGASTTTLGFAVIGNVGLLATTTKLYVFDLAARSVVATTPGIVIRARCAATSTHLVAFLADNAGNLITYVVDASTGAITGPTTIKTGLNATPIIDAIWYGGSTVTVVAITTTNTVRFIEFNPSTGALATDTTIGGGVLASAALSLFNDPTGSGIRFVGVGVAGGTPETRVVRCNSAGAIQTNDQVQAIVSTQITGVAHAAGADWSVVYQTAGGPRANSKVSGVVGTSALLRTTNTEDLTLDGAGWSEDGLGYWQAILGLHSSNVDDPQDTWVIATFPKGANVAQFTTHSTLVPGQGASIPALSPPFQATRIAANTFQFVLPVLYQYRNNAGTIVRQHSLDIFTQKWLTSADIGTASVGKPVQYKDTTFLPSNGIAYVDGGALRSIGTSAPPRIPVLIQAAGGAMTLLATYEYCVVIEKKDIDGNIWRSPPSVAEAITLTGANATVGVAISNWYSDELGATYTVAVYRTAANGSIFRRIRSFDTAFNVDLSFNDTASDASIVDGEILYTTGELSTTITPPASHICLSGDRLWAVNRDFRTELWPSKNLRPGRQPEFPLEGVVDIDDGNGDITGLASTSDDKLVVFKRNAIYFVTGDGLTDAGSGEAHRCTKIDQDIGAIPGSPVVAAGNDVYFVSDRGIYTVDRTGEVPFTGAPVDQYLNQPLVQTPETVFDGVFHPTKNWVVFVTTNYLLIHDRTLNYWMRWTGLAGMKRVLIVNNRIVLFRASDGTVWREGDHTQTTDQGVAYTGVIRCPWMNAAGEERGLRLYRARVDGARTAGGGSIVIPTAIYFDNDDAKVETYTSTAIAGGTTVIRGEMRPGQVQNQKCTSFSIAVTLPSSDVTLRIQRLTATVGVRGGKSELLPASGGVVFS